MITPAQAIEPDHVADHYDELDSFYREIWGEHVHHGFWENGRESPDEAIRKLVTLVAERAQIANGTSVCDVGCGYGATARMLAAEFGAKVTAFTISQAQYRFAISASDGKGPCFRLCDWLKNDLPPGTFDSLISIESSEHMADKPLFFSEANRVLRCDGRMVVCAWLAAENATPRQRRCLLEPICREGRMPGIGTESDYRGWFENAGFAVEDFEDLSARVKKTWPICVARFFANLARRPSYLRFLINRHARNRIFALTIARIWLAYEVGAMRYGIFTAARK